MEGIGAVDGLARATGVADACGASRLGTGVDPHAATAISSRLAIAGRRNADRTTETSDRVPV